MGLSREKCWWIPIAALVVFWALVWPWVLITVIGVAIACVISMLVQNGNMKPEFEVGDCVQIAAEFRVAGDAVTIYVVKDANEGRYIIEPLCTGYRIPQIQAVAPGMVEKLTPDHVVRCLKYANERGQEGAL